MQLRTQITYKELKRCKWKHIPVISLRTQITYKELKQANDIRI